MADLKKKLLTGTIGGQKKLLSGIMRHQNPLKTAFGATTPIKCLKMVGKWSKCSKMAENRQKIPKNGWKMTILNVKLV